ncbi:MAG: hypothetical protein ABIH59_00560 [archaeon]
MNKKEAKEVSPCYNFFPKNRRGQGLSTGAIILIIIGVIVLVILALGIFLGWEQIAPWIKSDNNVGDIEQACNLACGTKVSYDYCSAPRELKDGSNKFTASCYTFAMADGFEKYGIETCSDVDCASKIICEDWNYKDKEGVSKTEFTVGGKAKKDTPYCKPKA